MKQPCIFAINQLLGLFAGQKRLAYYLDLHAHANKRGVFTYGNALTGVEHLDALLFSKLASLNSPHFDFCGCNFTERNMATKDKDGTTKGGAGRVAWFHATGLTHLYTIEANYNRSKHPGELAELDGAPRNRAGSPLPLGRADGRYDRQSFHQVPPSAACVSFPKLPVSLWSCVSLPELPVSLRLCAAPRIPASVCFESEWRPKAALSVACNAALIESVAQPCLRHPRRRVQVGRALLITLLDMEDANPCSRVPRSPFRSVQGARDWLLATIKVRSFPRGLPACPGMGCAWMLLPLILTM